MGIDVNDDDNWLTEDGDAATVPSATQRPWRVLVVDDEPDIHAVTRLALHSVVFRGVASKCCLPIPVMKGLTCCRASPISPWFCWTW